MSAFGISTPLLRAPWELVKTVGAAPPAFATWQGVQATPTA